MDSASGVSELRTDVKRIEEQIKASREIQAQSKREMELQVADLQNQMTEQTRLLLSKISALSTQHMQAPGLFDGAEQRTRDLKQASLKKSSGQKQSGLAPVVKNFSVFEMEYPMWLVPVSTLLQFEKIPSHQEALARGMLVQYTPEIAADPDGKQLKELQRLLIRLMKGEVNVDTGSFSARHHKQAPTEAEWASSLPYSFVWLDFLSIPQPCVEVDLDLTTRRSGRDHRHGLLQENGPSAASKSAHQLALAVNSIPAYVRASNMMLVLTPFIRHKDRGNICSLQSWRMRGWCRLELATSGLTTHNLHVVACNGGEATPSFLSHIDAGQLLVGSGNFSCCACLHDFGNGVKVRCDKTKVRPVISKMMSDKVRYHKQQDEMLAVRTHTAMSWFYLQDLPIPADEKERNTQSLQEWRQTLMYGEKGDDWERSFEEEIGWPLLAFLVLSNSLHAVTDYLSQPRFDAKEILAVNRPHKDGTFRPGCSTLQLAVVLLPTFEVAGLLLQKLDEAGLREEVSSYTIAWGPFWGREDNVEKWLQLFPQHATSMEKQFTLSWAGMGSLAPLKALIDAGVDINEVASDWLHEAAGNYDKGSDIVSFLLESGEVGLINKVKGKVQVQASHSLVQAAPQRRTWLGRRLLPKRKQIAQAPAQEEEVVFDKTEGDSPLHRKTNILVMMQLLKVQPNGVNADLSLRNRSGQTASELVKAEYNNTTPPVLSELLRSAAYYNTNVVAGAAMRKPKAASRSTEITRQEMEDIMRAKDKQMEEMAEAMKAMVSNQAEMMKSMKEKEEMVSNQDEMMKAMGEKIREEIRKEMAVDNKEKQEEAEAQQRAQASKPAGPSAPVIANTIYGR